MLKIFSDFIESIKNSEDICLSIRTSEGGVININNNVLANYQLRNLLLVNCLQDPVKNKTNIGSIEPNSIRLNETTVILSVNDFTIKVKFNLSLTPDDLTKTKTKLSVYLIVANRKCGTTIDLIDLVEFSNILDSTKNYCIKASCKSINKTGYKKSINFEVGDGQVINQIKLFNGGWDSEMSALPDIKQFISFIIEESLENNEDLCDLIIDSIDDEN